MMKKVLKRYLAFLIPLAFILFVIIMLKTFTPSEIVSRIGVNNSYIILFLISAIGGSSLATASSYYVIIPIFAIAGLNPWLLGLFGGLGVSLGDLFYFYLGSKGNEASSGELNYKLKKVHSVLERIPRGGIPFFVYLWALTPLPNDVMTFSLGITGYPFKRVIIPIILGNITITVILSYLAIYGVRLFW